MTGREARRWRRHQSVAVPWTSPPALIIGCDVSIMATLSNMFSHGGKANVFAKKRCLRKVILL